MRIAQVLCKWKPMFVGYKPKYPGNVMFGKNHYVPPVNRSAKYFIMRQLKYEEENTQYLQNPYITEKQEAAYLQSVQKAHPDYYDDFMFKKLVKPERQRYTADYLFPLDASRKFEIQE